MHEAGSAEYSDTTGAVQLGEVEVSLLAIEFSIHSAALSIAATPCDALAPPRGSAASA